MNPFLLSTERIGAFEVRPFTLTTQNAIDALSKCEFSRVQQAASILWMQSRDESEVEQAYTDGSIEQKIREFAKVFQLAYMVPVEAWTEKQNECINEGRIEIIPRETSGGNDPGN
jgi:hypothetical protein